MLNCLAVGIGGFIGSVLRYLVSLIPIDNGSGFPYKTLAVNVLGSFLISAIAAYALKNRLDPRMGLLLRTGLCGGFTTFSTFAFETAGLMKNGSPFSAFLYVVLSVIAGVCAIFLAEIIFES